MFVLAWDVWGGHGSEGEDFLFFISLFFESITL